MNVKVFFNLVLICLLSACGGYITNTTVDEIYKPPSRTIETRIKSEEAGNTTGDNIHNYMDRLAVKVQTSEGITVVPYKEGFRVIINSELLFSGASHTVQDAPKCVALFKTIKESPYVDYLMEVHTDGEGTRYYNQSLTERRAESLKKLLTDINFPLDRLEIKAYGEDQPIAENSFEWGKYLNRRVEVGVFASEKLKELAKKGPVQ